ncbi:MAG: hypothetical protein NC833_01845, partial [Candidatus Omnitrophica bacterium]|nr:hypothetical protein [Candidatus Omnitrophota bacterium]
FRLKNYGLKEVWSKEEFLYHTWHPGEGGCFDYIGPHDGLNMSKTALTSIFTGRVLPLAENPAIKLLRTGTEKSVDDLLSQFKLVEDWKVNNIEKSPSFYSFLKKYPDYYFKILIIFYKFFLMHSFIPIVNSILRKIERIVIEKRKATFTDRSLQKDSVIYSIFKIYKIPKYYNFYYHNALINSLFLFYSHIIGQEVVVLGNKDLKKIIKYIGRKFRVNVRELDKSQNYKGKFLIAIIPDLEKLDFDIPTVNWVKYENEVKNNIFKLVNLRIKKEDILIL